MPHFLIIGIDHPPHSMALRDSLRGDHRIYVTSNDEALRLAGAMVDKSSNQCGSLYSVEADSVESVRDWLAAEPFAAGGVYETLKIVEWMPPLNRMAPTEWPTEGPNRPQTAVNPPST